MRDESEMVNGEWVWKMTINNGKGERKGKNRNAGRGTGHGAKLPLKKEYGKENQE